MNAHTKFRQSKEWKKFRHVMTQLLDCECQLCGTAYSGKRTKMLQLHHLNPENYTDLNPLKFKVVCSSCHDLIERFIIKKSWGVYEKKWRDLLEPFISKKEVKL